MRKHMSSNCRFALDEKRYVIDAVNVVNSGKGYCHEGAPEDDKYLRERVLIPAHHDEMATPSKPAQKTARAVEGPRAGAAGNQARVHGERRRGTELSAHHDEMATPSKPAQKTARAVEGPRAGAAGNQARVHGERRRGT